MAQAVKLKWDFGNKIIYIAVNCSV